MEGAKPPLPARGDLVQATRTRNDADDKRQDDVQYTLVRHPIRAAMAKNLKH